MRVPVLLASLCAALPAFAQGSFSSIGGPRGGAVRALVADPAGGVVLLQDDRLFCSFDEGQTWGLPAALAGVRLHRLEREGPALVARSAPRGTGQTERVWLSSDGCRAWRDVTGLDTRADRAVQGAAGWFVRDDSGRLLVSADQGRSWQETGASSSQPPQATGDGHVFSVLGNGSYPVLARWSADSTKWTPLRTFYFYARLKTGPGRAVSVVSGLVFGGDDLSVSFDGGATWPLRESDGLALDRAHAPDGSVYIAGSQSLMQARPDGSKEAVGPDENGFRTVAVTPSGTVVAAGCRANCTASALFRKTPGGAWRRAEPNEATSAVHAVEASQGRLFAANAVDVYERDAAGQWTPVPAVRLGRDLVGRDLMWTHPLEPVAPAALLLAPWGTLYQLGARVAVPVSAGKHASIPSGGGALVAHGDSTLLAARAEPWPQPLHRSGNRGRSWSVVDSVHARMLLHLEQGRVVVAGVDPRVPGSVHVRYSDDGGSTWSRPSVLTTPQGADLSLAVFPGTSTVVLVSGDGLFASSDAGASWERRGDGCSRPQVLARTLGRGVLACHADDGWDLFGTADAFRTRTRLDVPRFSWNPDVSLFGLPLPMDLLADGRLVLPDEGGGLRVSAWPVSNEPSDEGGASAAVHVAPNPVRGRARIETGALPGEDVRVEVLDLLGRRVALLHDGSASAAPLLLDTHGWAPGPYVVRVGTARGVSSRVFVVGR